MENKKGFDGQKYRNEWTKENMKTVRGSYKTEFVEEFKKAAKILGMSQSQIFRKAMEETIEKAKERQ